MKKKNVACRSRSRATRPSGRRASGTPSWTSRTGHTRTTRGTATRTGARWPPTPCGLPIGTGNRRTIRPTISSEDESCSWVGYSLRFLTTNKHRPEYTKPPKLRCRPLPLLIALLGRCPSSLGERKKRVKSKTECLYSDCVKNSRSQHTLPVACRRGV
jgi:hypothetical protein